MQHFRESRELLGTGIELQIVGESEARSRAGFAAAFAAIERIQASYSRFHSSNILSDLNESIGHWHPVSAELFGLLELGQELNRKTRGAFDLSVKSILESWDYDADYNLDRESAPGRIGEFELDAANSAVRLTAPIELGGLGKGLALQRAAETLADLPNIFVNAGGDVFARGRNAKAEPWTIFLQHPAEPDKMIGTVQFAESGFLAASSPQARKWRDRHHLVDARTAAPADSMRGVFVESRDSGLLADAWATALFVAGFELAKELQNEIPVESLLIGPGFELSRSSDFPAELFS